MGLEFLARVRRTSIWLAAVAGLLTATYRGPLEGLAVALGATFCLVNLFLLQITIVALTGADRNSNAALKRVALAILGTLALFAAGGFMLVKLPPLALMIGFTVPFAVIVLKIVTQAILPTRFWQRLTGSPWRAALAVVALVLVAWFAISSGASTTAARHHGSAKVQLASQSEPAGAPATATPTPHVEEEPKEEGPQKFPNVITVLHAAFPHASWTHFLHQYEVVIFSLLIAFLICVVAFAASRNPQMIPGPLQNVVEMLVEWLYNFVVGILGPKHGPRYVPFLGTLFVYILAMNLFGLIPFMDSPTSSLNVTVSLAIVVFLFSQFIGFKELGVVGYFDHLMGNPRTFIGWLLVPLMLPIHVMGELAKPISLSCRLFGNIFGEDMLLVAFATLGISMLSKLHVPFGVPLQLPFMFLALLTSTLQALVFTVLSTIYFLLMLPHDDHEHEHEGAAQHAH